MSSGSTHLPPAALSNAQSKAKIDQIAVRIISLPEGLRNNSGPVRISGTVTGQNQDGSVTIKTDRGDVSILLRDRGNIPQGKRIEIEIPAGRSPQQASIRESDAKPETSPPPSLAQTLTSQNESATAANTLKQNQKPISDTLGSVIVTTQSETTETLTSPPTIPIAGGPLTAGQTIRLIPIPPGALPQQILNSLTTPQTLPDLLNTLVTLIETLPKEQLALKTTLVTLLAKLDLSPLKQGLPAQNQIDTPAPQDGAGVPKPQIGALLNRIETLIQSIGITGQSGNETSAPTPLQTSPNPSLNLFNPSKNIDAQILAFQQSPSSAPNAPQNSEPQFLTAIQTLKQISSDGAPISLGQFIGKTAEGLPILSLPLPQTGLTQTYSLQFAATNTTEATPVFVAIDPQSTRPSQTILTQLPDGSLTLTPSTSSIGTFSWAQQDTWDSLDILLKTIAHMAPQQGQGLMQMLPNPAQPHSMAALSLFFISVLRTGNAENLIGNEAITLLRNFGKLDSLRNAATDIATAGRLEGLSLPQDWRMTMLPLLWENQIYKTPLYYKHFPEDGDKDESADKKRKRLRFLFDLTLSRMGDVQVDGFMQSERLDIILRTKTRLSQGMQGQMRQLYAGAMEKSRLTGELSFQSRPDQWVDFSGNFEKTGLNA